MKQQEIERERERKWRQHDCESSSSIVDVWERESEVEKFTPDLTIGISLGQILANEWFHLLPHLSRNARLTKFICNQSKTTKSSKLFSSKVCGVRPHRHPLSIRPQSIQQLLPHRIADRSMIDRLARVPSDVCEPEAGSQCPGVCRDANSTSCTQKQQNNNKTTTKQQQSASFIHHTCSKHTTQHPPLRIEYCSSVFCFVMDLESRICRW